MFGPAAANAVPTPGVMSRYSQSLLSFRRILTLGLEVFDEQLPALVMMPAFFRENGRWKVPTEPTNCPYTFAHRTGGRDCWSHIARFPERQANCNEAMKAHSFDGAWAVGLYPFAERLQRQRSGVDEKKTPLVVDVGGGVGYTSRKIRELCGGVEGTVVLQDLEAVVADAEDVDGVVKMAHDFFAEQPLKGEYLSLAHIHTRTPTFSFFHLHPRPLLLFPLYLPCPTGVPSGARGTKY